MWDSAKKPVRIRSVLNLDGTRHHFIINENGAGAEGGQQLPSSTFTNTEKCRKLIIKTPSLIEVDQQRQPSEAEDDDGMKICGNKLFNLAVKRRQYQQKCRNLSLPLFPRNPTPTTTDFLSPSDAAPPFSQSSSEINLTSLRSPLIKRLLRNSANQSSSIPSFCPDLLPGSSVRKSASASPEQKLCSRIMNWIDLEVRRSGTIRSSSLPLGISSTDLKLVNDLIPLTSSASSSNTSSSTNESRRSSLTNRSKTSCNSSSSEKSLVSSTSTDASASASSSSPTSGALPVLPTPNMKKSFSRTERERHRKKIVRISEDLPKLRNAETLSSRARKFEKQQQRQNIEEEEEQDEGKAPIHFNEVKVDDYTVYLVGETKSRTECTIEVPEKSGDSQEREMLEKLKKLGSQVAVDKLQTLSNFGYSVVWSNDPDFRTSEQNPWSITLPHFPLDSLFDAAKLLNTSPDISLYRLLMRLYPYDLIVEKEEGQLKAVNETIQGFGFMIKEAATAPKSVGKSPTTASEYFCYAPVQSHENVVGEMLESFQAKRDICLIGDRGSGKSVMISRFAELIGNKIEPIVLYKDMTARDLLQQRATKPDGDTVWKNAPLVTAALEGKLAVLDGLDQVHSSTVAVIYRLIHDRELQLHDGTRLLRADRYEELKSKYGYLDQEMNEAHGIFKIHPDFYIVATAALPTPPKSQGKDKKQWLTPEMLSLFFYHRLPQMSLEEEMSVIKSLCGLKKLPRDIHKIISTARELRESQESSKRSLSSSLTTRQLVRIAKRTEKFQHNSDIGPFEEVSRACLSRFLPPLNKEELESVMYKNGILSSPLKPSEDKKVKISNGHLSIGSTSAKIRDDTEHKSKVPHVLFYDIQQHVRILEELLQDYLLGEHILLVGNQGVGKNKLVDQLLYLLNRPREYIQLHRDTTVQALTVQQKVIDGVLLALDSPLVRAAREGHVIVIDEADKAPTHVTCILKTLAESGEMILSDGRRIVPQDIIDKHYQNLNAEEMNAVIPLHPDFRMFVLANRPGFPFLGNDFYSVLGDLFSVHAIDNPSFESEMELLKNYAPDISVGYLERIAKAFGDLRKMADDGTINYPYSTREAVNIVKHLRKFPNDSLSEAIDNVFDFDVYNSELRQTVKETLKKYNLSPSEGVLLRSRSSSEGSLDVKKISKADFEKLKRAGDLAAMQASNKNFQSGDFKPPKHGKVDASGAPHVGGNQWAGGSGGMGTAGLGGAGGPYRLSSGNPVFQVSEKVKEAVPPEVRKMAREMARKAFEEKLKEIKMSKYEGNVYEEFLGPIRPQVQALRVILTSLQAKAKERKWVRHQTSGELDDSKIIEGVIGEKNVYKLRKEEDPEPGDPQQKPKRLKLVVDCSGSMYRFNGYDRRLDRVLECSLMVMESFKGFEDIFQYEIVGHSGDDFKLPLVGLKDVPNDNKERLDILRTLHLHSQFCSSGDNTLEATQDAIKSLGNEIDQVDEAFVIVLSDANLERYGINPKELAKILNANSDVKAFSVFIGSLGDQAQRLTEQLPPGKAYVCLDTTQLPKILQRIFTQSILH